MCTLSFVFHCSGKWLGIDKELAEWFCRAGFISFSTWSSSSICDSLVSIFLNFLPSLTFQHLPGASSSGPLLEETGSSLEDWHHSRLTLFNAGRALNSCGIWVPIICKAQPGRRVGRRRVARPICQDADAFTWASCLCQPQPPVVWPLLMFNSSIRPDSLARTEGYRTHCVCYPYFLLYSPFFSSGI